ncbi:putative major facilitator superfamily transporter [Ectopseudomonas mendocina]|jgi:MFS family permease|uniref:Putative major facilitator superfamily transporter n=1 Tax=Ectopseudomonas mendocina TaxID=300 RepID=A0A379IRT6_ECTME|nr:MFS transporter [Pseudomonas mendocina]SUD34689.1 putative major facilitator superfamily transporter [Pseudomonas mendocina]SUD38999.1 putative major facilitator superfamily transporter [Pseudomonas mendocina]VEE16861.1 putative major facilitator superfamily transporter [Pseudomonas mendocina]
MFSPLVTFPALYSATLLMLAGSGLFSTYMGLRLTEEGAGDAWVGGLMAAYYFGLVCGGKFGHKLIASVGHIRSYVACAGIATVIVLLHVLVERLEVWLLLRFVMGAVMMNQYMVIESWLNEQSENHMRGKVFAGYMVAVDLGLVVGQGLLAMSPTLDYKPLVLVAICFASCLIPLAVTRRVHPAKLVAAPLEIGFFCKRVPQALGSIFVAGLMVGAFYGLAPVYASRSGLDTAQASLFVAICIIAGFCAQWPLGWLSDRLDRSWLIRGNAILLCLVAIPMWGLFDLPYWLLLANGFVTGMLLFTLYPLAVALGNDHVEQARRVALSAMLLTTYGVGACIGPLLAGFMMQRFGPGMFYMLVSLYAVVLIFWVQPKRVTGRHRVDEAPLSHVPMPDTVSPMAAALDPRVDEVPEDLLVDAPVSIGRSDGEPDPQK